MSQANSNTTPQPPKTRAVMFDPAAFERQMAFDKLARRVVLLLLFAGVFADWFVSNESIVPLLLLGVAAAGWFALSTVTVRAVRTIPLATVLMDGDPDQAESVLQTAIARLPLQKAARIMLYHRLAMLRVRQSRLAEAVAICQSLLAHRLGKVERLRVHLLLMLVESSLRLGDLATAHGGLIELNRMQLSLVDRLQLLALQTRYEVACGYDAVALFDVDMKVRSAEMMPAPQCGALHAMLAGAAHRTGRTTLAQWLQERATLFATNDQIESLLGVAKLDTVA